jgi:hypothetical protein
MTHDQPPPGKGCQLGGGSRPPHLALLLVAAGILVRLTRVWRGRWPYGRHTRRQQHRKQ